MPACYTVQPSLRAPTTPPPPSAPKPPVAIIVAHGMGQQIPFQTLDDVAEGLLARERRPSSGPPPPKPVARTVALGDERMARLEVKLAVGDHEREVHIYEAYWAPLTEGRVTLRDVTGFLLRGGLAGIGLGLNTFKRWIFGQYEEFPAPVRSVLYLLITLSVIVSLMFLNFLIVAIAAARAPLRSPPGWLSDAMFRDLTSVLNALVACFLPFALLMLVWMLAQRWKWQIPAWLAVPAFLLAVWATLAAALVAAIVVGYHAGIRGEVHPSFFDQVEWIGAAAGRFDAQFDAGAAVVLPFMAVSLAVFWLWGMSRALVKSLGEDETSRWFTVVVCLAFTALFTSLAWLAAYLVIHARLAGSAVGAFRHGLSWPLVIAAAAIVRRFLIQYAGDVAAYVQPQVVDKFDQLRKDIKNAVWKATRAVYGVPEYGHIMLVGHSLGSVVMYDVLNRLLVDQALGDGKAPDVATRTRLLLTFGSPLDKTAFIFGTQGTGSEAREALSASAQPLITQPSVRPIWINIYSRRDIISGSLDYYDLRDRSNRNPVQNFQDPYATTLLAAHVEYWRTPLVFETLMQALKVL